MQPSIISWLIQMNNEQEEWIEQKMKTKKTKTISICNWKTLNPHLAIVWRIYLLYCVMFYIRIDIDFDHNMSWKVGLFQKQYLTTLLKKLKILFEYLLVSCIFLNGWEKDKKEIIQPYYCSGWFPVPISFLPSLQRMNTDSFNEMPRFASTKSLTL
jgi:hypothetical protein